MSGANAVLNAYDKSYHFEVPDETDKLTGATIKRMVDFDPLWPRSKMLNISHPLVPILEQTGSSINNFGQMSTFTIPYKSVNFFGESALHYSLGALTSGNYCKNVGLCAVKSLQVYNGSTLVIEIKNYKEHIMTYLKEHPNDVQSTILSQSGGNTFASGNVITPLFLPHSRLCAGFSGECYPIPIHCLSSDLIIKVTWETSANILASGATGSASFAELPQLFWQSYEVDKELKDIQKMEARNWFFKSTTTDMVQSASLIGGTDNVLSITSMKKEYSDLLVYAKMVANYDTSHDYFALTQISRRCQIAPNGKTLIDLYNNGNDATAIVDWYLLMNSSKHTCDTDIVRIPFGYHSEPEESHNNFFGGVNAAALNSIDVTVNTSTGPYYAFIVGIRHIIMRIDKDGILTITDN